jgi:hypothetical protein
MKKSEMLMFVDKQPEAIRQRGTIASGVTKTRMRKEWESMSAIRGAISKHVPADPVSAVQTEIDPFRPR